MKSYFSYRVICICVAAVFAGTAEASDRATQAEASWLMRMDYTASASYDPYATGVHEARSASEKFLEAGKYEKAIAEAAKGLVIDQLNIDLLMVEAAAYRAKGDISKADEIRQKWMSLVDSIVDRKRGDGRSFETAFKVISVDEEYAVLGVFGFKRIEQRLVLSGGSSFDVLRVKSEKSGDESDLYFNVDIPQKWLHRHLIEKEQK